jgi:dimethylhistidine N-methyltransferase
MFDHSNFANPALLEDALAGLGLAQKAISPKWFYDQPGSELFEEITRLEEYYPTRTEIAILRARAAEICTAVAKGTALVELGSGASVKTRILLSGQNRLTRYVPIDISAEFLAQTAGSVASDLPGIVVDPVVADFMAPIALPRHIVQTEKLLFFPGSTLGNLDPVQAYDLLLRLRGMPRVAGFVLGVDLVKDAGVLLRAYDDAQGVTAAFNLNLLARLNREAAANFDLAAFRHEARWNAADARIEMHLVSQSDQVVTLAGRTFRFRAGESLHPENSHKFTREGLMALLQATGWMAEEYWTDPADHFAVLLLRPF